MRKFGRILWNFLWVQYFLCGTFSAFNIFWFSKKVNYICMKMISPFCLFIVIKNSPVCTMEKINNFYGKLCFLLHARNIVQRKDTCIMKLPVFLTSRRIFKSNIRMIWNELSNQHDFQVKYCYAFWLYFKHGNLHYRKISCDARYFLIFFN